MRRRTPWRRTGDAALPTLSLPDGVGVDEVERLLRRYDPDLVRRRARLGVAGGGTVGVRRGALWVAGDDRLARGLHHHLGGEWQAAPPAPGSGEETVEDMLRVYVPRTLLPAEVATLLSPVRPNIRIREDPKLDLFWFDDDDSVLNVSAWAVTDGPVALGRLRTAETLFECGIDDVTGPTAESAAEAWLIAMALDEAFGGVPVDRYGFRLTRAEDLLPSASSSPTPTPTPLPSPAPPRSSSSASSSGD